MKIPWRLWNELRRFSHETESRYMKKLIYLQINNLLLSKQEQDFFACFLEARKQEQYEIIRVQMQDGMPITEVMFLPEVEVFSEKQRDLFGIAICQDQEIIDYFREESIPVIAYEMPDTKLHNSHIILSFEEINEQYLKMVYNRFYHMSMEILTTKRCLVREFCMTDMDDLFALYQSPHMTDYLEPLYDREEEEAYESTYIEKIYGFYGYGMWVIIQKGTNRLIGRAGIESREGCQKDEVELGYAIASDLQQCGYAYEVCKAIIDYTFENYSFLKIISRVHPQNTASVKLSEKLGFLKRDNFTQEIEDIYELDRLIWESKFNSKAVLKDL